MLVLTRKKNERIKIGQDVEVMVVEIRGEQVRLGIAAPAEVAVHRAEIARKIEQQRVPRPNDADTQGTKEERRQRYYWTAVQHLGALVGLTCAELDRLERSAESLSERHQQLAATLAWLHRFRKYLIACLLRDPLAPNHVDPHSSAAQAPVPEGAA